MTPSQIEQVMQAIRELDKNMQKLAAKVEKLDAKVEKLDENMKNGFKQVNERFDKIEKRMDTLENRFDQFENQYKEDMVDVKGQLQNQTDNTKFLYKTIGTHEMHLQQAGIIRETRSTSSLNESKKD